MNGSLEIPLTKGLVALVDMCDYQRLRTYKWRAFFRGKKPPMAIRGTGVLMHREILGLDKGDKRMVDHINGNPLDNRRCNLRTATASQNSQNRSIRVDNATGLKGVSQKGRGWAAFIGDKGKIRYLGVFKTPEDAHLHYCAAAREIYGDFFCDGTRI